MNHERPDWTNFFLGLAFCVAQRSIDPVTRHGTIICDRHRHVIGVGFNGFPRGMNDNSLPIHRPDPNKPDELNKYDFVEGTHSERNAIAHCMISPWLIEKGAIAYITGEPCNACLSALWQANITKIYYAKRHGSQLINERTRQVRDIIVQQTGIEIHEVIPDLSWIVSGLEEPIKLGFFPQIREWIGQTLRYLAHNFPTKMSV